jgi:hypothetical protein
MMRDDQITRLKELAEEVAEVFVSEADPRFWSGAGMELADMDAETRGGRYWDKKNAIQTGTLLARVLDLAERDQNRSKEGVTAEHDAEKEIARFEAKAKDLLNNVQQRGRH